MRAPPSRLRRGQAITEFALVLPVMIVILLYSMYFTELVRANLKMQEASRYVAWEMTSYALDDYGRASPNHALAFDTAQEAAVIDALDKYKDLESIDNRPPGGLVVGYSNVKAKIANLDAPLLSQKLPGGLGNNSFIGGLLTMLNGGMTAIYQHFKFNTRGKVQVELTMQLDNRLLPQHFLDENGGFFTADMWGGRNLQNVTLKNRFTLLASGWQLADGADAEQHQSGAGGPRAGVHRGGSDTGLYLQVERMRLLGAPQKLGSIPGYNDVMTAIGNFVPNPLNATYVTSHNYFAAGEGNIKNRGCDQDPGHEAQWGMNNLDDDQGTEPGLDWRRRKCYDTAPFRDTSKYDNSHYRSIYKARGPWFMGCKKPQADNPSEAAKPDYSDKDKHNKKYECEGP